MHAYPPLSEYWYFQYVVACKPASQGQVIRVPHRRPLVAMVKDVEIVQYCC